MVAMSDADSEPPQVTVIFRQPIVRPGTPEAQEAGCLCRFESNMRAAFLAAESSNVPDDHTFVVIHKHCPLHNIVDKPMDDALGDL